MKKKGKFLYKIMFPYVLLTVAILAVSFLTLYFFSYGNSKRTSLDYTEKLIRQVDRSVNNYVNIMNSIFDAATEDPLIQSFFTDQPQDAGEISDKLNFVVNTRNDVLNIFLMKSDDFSKGMTAISDEKNAKINQNSNYVKSAWYEKLFSENRDYVFTSSYVQNLIEGRYDWVISLGKKVFEGETLRGVILIDLKYSSIIKLCEDAMPGKSGYVFILDDGGSIVYHPKQQLIYSNLWTEQTALAASLSDGESVEKDGRLYIVSNEKKSSWRIAGVIELGLLTARQLDLFWFFLATAAGFALVAGGLSYLISKRVTRPILSLDKTVKRVQEGDLTAKAVISTSDEVGALGESFNEMTTRIAELMVKNEREQIEKRESVLWALKAQINPHFLYNTLDSIIWMAEMGRTEDIVEMTSSLAKMLRASIGKNSDNATLKVELENVRNYLKIQKYRYQNKLNYEIDVPEELCSLRAEHLSLQPLVENAIYHGIRDKREGGTIRITARREDDKLVIKVCDDGKGMPQSRIEEIMNREESTKSMGVRNVDNRIKLTFGAEYGLSIESAEGRGTTVTLTLPASEVKNEIL